VNRPTSRALLVAVVSMLATAALAAPAQATLAVSSFTLTPSTLQAGGVSAKPGPDLTLDAKFSSSDGDTPKDATISLAPGLLANPNIPLCTTAQFQANNCPAGSHIATGFVTGTAPAYGLTLAFPTDGYLVQPTGSEIARFGIITTFFDYPVVSLTAPVVIRKTPTFGIDIPITGLPNSIDGTQVIVDGLHLTITGQVNGATFTRNPTSCAPAPSSLTVDSYAVATPVSQQSSFTPTGCSTLPYAPTIAGTAAEDTGDDGVGMTATITQKYEESDNQTVNLILPHSLSPRLSVLASACTAADLTTCASIGSATITTPLLANPITAKVVLVAHTGAIPTLAILVPAPISLELDATPILTGTSVQALVANIPDIPLSSLQLTLPGGTTSLFRAGTHFCTTAQVFGGSFTGWSGATASPSAAATITGCPVTSAAALNSAPITASSQSTGTTGNTGSTSSTGTGASAPTGTGASAPTGTVAVTGLATDHARITLAVGTPKKSGGLRSVTVRLPQGLGLRAQLLRSGIAIKLDGHRVVGRYTLHGGVLTITFAKPGRVAFITITAPALTVSQKSARQARTHHAGKLTVRVTVQSANGRSTSLSLKSNAT
jgi:hypothetical protein